MAEFNLPPARLDLAATCREDVLDPVALRAIGEGEDVEVAVAKHIHRGGVRSPGFAPDMADDRESRQPTSDMASQRVGHTTVEARDYSWDRHGSFLPASGFRTPWPTRHVR